MKKSDLVVGKHYAKLRSGMVTLLMLQSDIPMFIGENQSEVSLRRLNSDLLHCEEKKSYREFDVMAIGVRNNGFSKIFEDIKWIWELKELKHNVGDCFKNKHGNYWKIMGKENNYYQIAKIDKYGRIIDDGYPTSYFTDEDFKNDEPYTPIERPKKKEMTIKEIEDILGYEIKVVT